MSYKIHNRQSIRLKGYDYSQAGLYFVTICTHNRECLFGNIVGAENFLPNNHLPEMVLNDIGKIANDCWLEIPNHFPNAVLHEHIIMPNHVHGIIELVNNTDVGNTDMWPRHGVALPDNMDNTVGTCHGMSLQQPSLQQPSPPSVNQFGKPVVGSVSVIINQYKSAVKRWCNKNEYQYFKWQSRFHDHIIRNHQSYVTISEYIIHNPMKWKDDKFYIKK